MNIKRIFLDVDDVLVDFSLAAMKHVGVDLGRIDWDSYYERWGYSIVSASNNFLKPLHLTEREFWLRFARKFWANLKKTEECDTLIEAAYNLVGEGGVYLLTAPIQDPECAAGKMELIRDTFPEFWKDRRYLIAPPKFVCASPDSLLIDDSDANVNAFRKAGGQAALFAKPWNSAHARRDNPLQFSELG